MGFVEFEYNPPAVQGGVKIAICKGGGQKRNMMITLGRDVYEKLGWDKGERVRIFFGTGPKDGGKAQILKTNEKTAGMMLQHHTKPKPGKTASALRISRTIDCVGLLSGATPGLHKATLVEYEQIQGGLQVTLPEWFFVSREIYKED